MLNIMSTHNYVLTNVTMPPMKRTLWISLAVILASFLVFVVYFAWLFFRTTSDSYKVPTQLIEARIVAGSGELRKNLLYEGSGLGVVSDIRSGWPADKLNADLVAVGSAGAHFLNSSGVVKQKIAFFENVYGPVEIVRLDWGGDFGFLTREESWAGPVLLFDRHGAKRWSYGSHFFSGADDSTAGDVDGDGNPEFAVSMGQSIHVISHEGREIWKSWDLNIWHVEILPANADGPGRILHSNAGGELVVLDARGHRVARYLPGHYVGNFALTRWGAEEMPTHILAPDERKEEGGAEGRRYFILNSQGNIVSQIEAPLGTLLPDAKGTSILFDNQHSSYALLLSYYPAKRSMLFIFDTNGSLMYHEIIGDNCRGIAPQTQGLRARLLVGCTNKVWAYELVKSLTPGGRSRSAR